MKKLNKAVPADAGVEVKNFKNDPIRRATVAKSNVQAYGVIRSLYESGSINNDVYVEYRTPLLDRATNLYDGDVFIGAWCGHHQQFELLLEVQWPKKASTTTGYHSICTLAVDAYKRKSKALKELEKAHSCLSDADLAAAYKEAVNTSHVHPKGYKTESLAMEAYASIVFEAAAVAAGVAAVEAAPEGATKKELNRIEADAIKAFRAAAAAKEEATPTVDVPAGYQPVNVGGTTVAVTKSNDLEEATPFDE